MISFSIEQTFVIIYFLATLGFGFYKRSGTDVSSFLFAGRKLTIPALVATLVSTWYGGILEVGRFTYENGIVTWLIFGVFYYVAALLFVKFIAPKIIGAAPIKKLPKFDFVIFFGILHHLSNKEADKMLTLCKRTMKKNSKLLTEDPILLEKQNIIAKFLIEKDRGINVRQKKEYINLLKKHFKKIKNKVTHQFFIPYTWFTTICSK